MTPAGRRDVDEASKSGRAPRDGWVELSFTDDGPNVGVRPGSSTHLDFLRLARELLGDLMSSRRTAPKS